MRGHNIWYMYYAELTKIIPNYHQVLPLILSSDFVRNSVRSENLIFLFLFLRFFTVIDQFLEENADNGE